MISELICIERIIIISAKHTLLLLSILKIKPRPKSKTYVDRAYQHFENRFPPSESQEYMAPSLDVYVKQRRFP